MNKLMQAARAVQSVGSNGSRDTILAHITPQEAAMLKARGGSGQKDQNTGLPHYDDGGGDGGGGGEGDGGGGGYAYSNPAASYASQQADQSQATNSYTPISGHYTDAEGHRPGTPDTLGGRIANFFGGDPFGTAGNVANGVITVLGALSPAVGAVNKLATVALNAGRSDMPSGSVAQSLNPFSALSSLTSGSNLNQSSDSSGQDSANKNNTRSNTSSRDQSANYWLKNKKEITL